MRHTAPPPLWQGYAATAHWWGGALLLWFASAWVAPLWGPTLPWVLWLWVVTQAAAHRGQYTGPLLLGLGFDVPSAGPLGLWALSLILTQWWHEAPPPSSRRRALLLLGGVGLGIMVVQAGLYLCLDWPILLGQWVWQWGWTVSLALLWVLGRARP